jgi:hypothetical protein
MKRHLLPAALIAVVHWALPSALFAQYEVVLDPATARLIYLASSEGPGIPGGLPNPYMLHFGMDGMLRIDEQQGNTGKVTLADFVLVGNEAAFQNDPQKRARIEDTSRQILLTAMFTVERGPPLDRTLFRADVAGPDLEIEFFRQTLVRMAGGPDLRLTDGDGFQYVYPVPEPGALAFIVAACCCGGAWWLKSRSRGRNRVYQIG